MMTQKMEEKLIFSNSEFKLNSDFFDESSINLKIEKVSNDNYTKLYS